MPNSFSLFKLLLFLLYTRFTTLVKWELCYLSHAGGAKERVENTYYCNGCQKVIELDHAIPRNTINEINNNIITLNDSVADLENEIALTFDYEDLK